MAIRKNLNPLLSNTDGASDNQSDISSEVSESTEQESASGVDALADHMASSINVLETKSDYTKSTILRAIEEIKTQIEDERAISDALRKDLEAAKNALAEKEGEGQRLQSELASSMTKAGIIEGLKDEIAFMTKELKSAHDNMENQKNELAEKDRAFKDLQTRLITVEQERSKILTEIKSEMGNSMKLQRDLAEIAKQKDDAVREKNSLATKYKSLESELNRMREESRALDEIQQALSDTRKSSRR
jgi:chromosome segregation ATPase